MANKKPYEKSKIQDTEGSGFGQYQEGVGGGGSPMAKDPNQRSPGVNSDHRKANNDTMQPRTGDGKFTYKSVNGESINPEYGPSRGKTVNPLLTHGENGVKIDDVKNDFANQSGKYWDKYKENYYTTGGEVVTAGDFKTHVAGADIWDVGKRRYDTVKGEFEGEHDVFAETKKGRRAADEKAAQQKAQASGQETPVIDQNTGAMKIKPGTPKLQAKQIHVQPSAPQEGMKAPETPVVQAEASEPTQQPAQNGSKYTAEEFKAAREAIKKEMEKAGMEYDPLFDDDEVLAEYLDQNGGKELFSYDEPTAPAKQPTPAPAPAPKESEAEKKIKAMGFSE